MNKIQGIAITVGIILVTVAVASRIPAVRQIVFSN